ncbi:hypothetical protein [Marinobacterium aestuariivivens]|uniref:Uncharacterized protein n=1 Tax=Marinobacterium aestuariivivens TaxID=1698799 RepID=A0ABW2A0V9_9GAMM
MAPGGGWQAGNLVEVLYDTEGCGELRLLLPLLAQAPADRWVLWVDPPIFPMRRRSRRPAFRSSGCCWYAATAAATVSGVSSRR